MKAKKIERYLAHEAESVVLALQRQCLLRSLFPSSFLSVYLRAGIRQDRLEVLVVVVIAKVLDNRVVQAGAIRTTDECQADQTVRMLHSTVDNITPLALEFTPPKRRWSSPPKLQNTPSPDFRSLT